MATDRAFRDSPASGSSREDELIEAAFREVFGRCPKEIGRYRVIRQVGAGGMGVVYEAEQDQPQRRVAVKLTRASTAAGPRYARMLRREIQVLARLRHPCIAQIFDAGHTPEGQQYSVMEFVDGVPLDAYCRASNLPLRDKLALFVRVCDAVRYAHQRGVIHRDLKPANILVDGDGLPHVLDFGLAQLIDPEPDAARTISQAQGWVGTLRYMSPEQIQTDKAELDIRTDIYSLGVILYQMLTDRFPYEVVGNMRDVLDNILSAEPIPPRTVSPLVDDELETIVLKCLSKERERRYQTAGDLARDIEHYLVGEAIEAKRDSTFYVLRKTLRRYRIPVATIVVFILLMTAALGLSLHFWRQAARERDRSNTLAETRRREAYNAQMLLAQQAWTDGDVKRAVDLLNDYRPQAGQNDLRGFEWFYLWRQIHHGQFALQGHAREVRCVEYSPAGTMIATGGYDKTVRLWDVATWSERLTLRGHANVVESVAFSPDGRILATGSWDSVVKLWDVNTGQEVETTAASPIVGRKVTFAPDGKLLASIGGSTLRLWRMPSGQELSVYTAHSGRINDVVFSPHSDVLATTSEDKTARLWDISTGAVRTVFTRLKFSPLAFSPDGALLAVGGPDSAVRIWDMVKDQELITFTGHANNVNALAFAPDGKILASGSSDRMVKLWDTRSWELLATFRGHKGKIRRLSFSPDGRTLVSAGGLYGEFGEVKVWEVAMRQQACTTLEGHTGLVMSAAFSPDSRTLATASIDKTAKLWEVATGRLIATLEGQPQQLDRVVFSPDGETLVTVVHPGDPPLSVDLWHMPTRRLRDTLHDQSCPSFSPDGLTLATCGGKNVLNLWDLKTLSLRAVLEPYDRNITCIMFAPDGKVLATAHEDWTVNLWDVATQRIQCSFRAPYAVGSLAFSPDSKSLATAGGPLAADLWDADMGRHLLEFKGHLSHVWTVAFSPDGKTVLTGSEDNTARLWDATSGQERATLRGHTRWVWSVAFSPNGEAIATTGWDNTARLWKAAKRDEVSSAPE